VLDGLTISREAFARTVRLVSTARLREAVLGALVDTEDELALLAELEGATSTRLVAQGRGFDGVASAELVYGVPHAKFINAAFAYAKPRELNRFNGLTRGAWYAALDTETSLREVTFHITGFLEQAGDFHAVVDYTELFASLAGEYLDLRPHSDHPSLSPDKATAYPIGNALADAARVRGLNGIIYPSVRHLGGTCFAVLWPHAVQSVAQGEVIRLTWRGERVPIVERGVGAD
jgi:hypothetical protein